MSTYFTNLKKLLNKQIQNISWNPGKSNIQKMTPQNILKKQLKESNFFQEKNLKQYRKNIYKGTKKFPQTYDSTK